MEKPQYGHQVFFDEIKVLDERKTAKTDIRYVETKSFGNILFMDGEVQLSTMDEHRYHEKLVHPLLSAFIETKKWNILVIGGGDGCAVREILKWGDCIGSITVVDYDDEFVHEYGMKHLATVNQDAFKNPLVSYVCDDAVSYLKRETFKFDAIFIDLPDPDGEDMIALYEDVIRLALTRYSEGISMHVGPAIIDPKSPQRQIIAQFKKLLSEGLNPYHTVKMGTCYVPSFSNDWAFLYIIPISLGRHMNSMAIETYCKYWSFVDNNDFICPKDLK